MTVTIAEAILEASQILRKAGITEHRREAGSLLISVIDKDRTFLISHAENQLEPDALRTFWESVERRALGEPLQYITGHQDFYGRIFRVTHDVLIPRPETELVVEAALQLLESESAPLICDIGTGSGCIAVSLLSERRDARSVAVDISPAALAVAEENAIEFGVDERVTFVVSDCFESLPLESGLFDLIVSNPPYVAESAVPGLQREVRDHEPMIALTPGGDGLSIIRRLLDEAPTFLRKHGYLLLEIGFDQSAAVTQLSERPDWRLLEIRPDLQGIPRIVILQKT